MYTLRKLILRTQIKNVPRFSELGNQTIAIPEEIIKKRILTIHSYFEQGKQLYKIQKNGPDFKFAFFLSSRTTIIIIIIFYDYR